MLLRRLRYCDKTLLLLLLFSFQVFMDALKAEECYYFLTSYLIVVFFSFFSC